MKIGDKITGTITSIKPYGAFAALDSGTASLIHISEIKTSYIENTYQLLSVSEKVLVQAVDFDEFTQEANLSLRTPEGKKHHLHRRHHFSNSHLNIDFQPLADNLPEWTKGSLGLLTKEQQKSLSQ